MSDGDRTAVDIEQFVRTAQRVVSVDFSQRLRGRAAPELRQLDARHIAEILATYRAQNICRVVALCGDLPSGTPAAGESRYAAEPVSFIRETQGPDWQVEVAPHPEHHAR